jgi:hypothetical protein
MQSDRNTYGPKAISWVGRGVVPNDWEQSFHVFSRKDAEIIRPFREQKCEIGISCRKQGDFFRYDKLSAARPRTEADHFFVEFPPAGRDKGVLQLMTSNSRELL